MLAPFFIGNLPLLAVVISRNEKHAMALPLEDFLRAIAGPDARQPSPLKHVHHFADRHSERWQRFSPLKILTEDRGSKIAIFYPPSSILSVCCSLTAL